MKVAIYVRTSKRDMHPENQLLKLKEFAEKNNWQYDVYEEKESTRKTRPIKEIILSKLRQKEYAGLLIYKLDRWARSLPELVLEIQELIDKGIMFCSFCDNIDLSSATGRLYFHILSSFAEFERDLIRERTLDGLDRARAEGKTLGRPKKILPCKNKENYEGKTSK